MLKAWDPDGTVILAQQSCELRTCPKITSHSWTINGILKSPQHLCVCKDHTRGFENGSIKRQEITGRCQNKQQPVGSRNWRILPPCLPFQCYCCNRARGGDTTGTRHRLTVWMPEGLRNKWALLNTWEHLTGWRSRCPGRHTKLRLTTQRGRCRAYSSARERWHLAAAAAAAPARQCRTCRQGRSGPGSPRHGRAQRTPPRSAGRAPRADSRASVTAAEKNTWRQSRSWMCSCRLGSQAVRWVTMELSLLLWSCLCLSQRVTETRDTAVPWARSSLGITPQRLCAHHEQRATKQLAAAAVQASCGSGGSQQGTSGRRMGPERNLPGNTFLTCPHTQVHAQECMWAPDAGCVVPANSVRP